MNLLDGFNTFLNHHPFDLAAFLLFLIAVAIIVSWWTPFRKRATAEEAHQNQGFGGLAVVVLFVALCAVLFTGGH